MRIAGSRFWVGGLELRVQGLGARVQGAGLKAPGRHPPPNAWPMHCKPMQTPKRGTSGPSVFTTSSEIPESFGVPAHKHNNVKYNGKYHNVNYNGKYNVKHNGK